MPIPTRHVDPCLFLVVVGLLVVHADVAVSAGRQLVAGHPLRPLEAVLLHERQAALHGPPADLAAGRHRLVVVLHADGGVHGAQEELEVGRAVDLHQRPELVNL